MGLTAPQKRRYFLAGLLICGGCGRKMEPAWSNGKPAYRVSEDLNTQAGDSSPEW